jgi:hypothetical protein
MPDEDIIVAGQVRATTNILSQYLEMDKSKYPVIINILHFRADEWLEIDDSRHKNCIGEIILSRYRSSELRNAKTKISRIDFSSFYKLVLILFKILKPRVSRKDQFDNYRNFLDANLKLENLTLVLIDTRIRFRSPLFQNIERSYRSKLLKSMIRISANAMFLDYAQLGIRRSHFQKDKLHLNSLGNRILAKAIFDLITSELKPNY